MAEYLEREALLHEMKMDIRPPFAVVRDFPPADVAPVVHGKWIDKGWDGDFSWRIDGRGNSWHIFECSNCGSKLCGVPKTKFCQNCGARMDLEDEKDDRP